MLRKILKQINDYKEKNGKYPEYINITKKGYRRLKRELDIVEDKTDDIKMIYLMEFKIIEGDNKWKKDFVIDVKRN